MTNKTSHIEDAFYLPLGKAVAKFAFLDDTLVFAIFSLMSGGVPYSSPPKMPEQKRKDFAKFRLIASGIPTMERANILKRLALYDFPEQKPFIMQLYKELKTSVESRNPLVHHMWHSFGQIGFNPNGTAQVTRRTSEDINRFANDIYLLSARVRILHKELAEHDENPSTHEYSTVTLHS